MKTVSSGVLALLFGTTDALDHGRVPVLPNMLGTSTLKFNTAGTSALNL